MTQEELYILQKHYGFDILTYEERHSLGVEGFKEWSKTHIIPIPKSELQKGIFYSGCTEKGTMRHLMWNGNRFQAGINSDAIYYYYEDFDTDKFVPFKVI